ncbi:MAG: hypothetical protein GY722_29140 [bacterium]|nr:hypothetical protein [bacterium]
MNEEWERWRGGVDADIRNLAESQKVTDRNIAKIYERLRLLELRVAGVVAGLIILGQIAEYLLRNWGN